jgi:hypothetical protein
MAEQKPYAANIFPFWKLDMPFKRTCRLMQSSYHVSPVSRLEITTPCAAGDEAETLT